MLISLDWIKDFVQLPEMSPQELGSRFTLATAEVEAIHLKGQGLALVQIVQVVSKRPHPEADKLNLVTFETGKGTREVVCGAPNVREGMKVFYAPVGTTLPSGLTLEPKKIRNVLSDGMLCSSSELGLGAGQDGLMELPTEATVGMRFADYVKAKEDIILEVDNKSLTHRPDLWGHYGLAREFAAAHGNELKDTFNAAWEKSIEARFNKALPPIGFQVAQDSSCWAYLGLSIEGVTVGASPRWITERLEAVGLRPINNIVDVSNYVMLELGMPNHIFDAETIEGKNLLIRRQGTAGQFKTLDGVERDLVEADTVIADAKGASVLAGIMGGETSGVSEKTTKVFLEVANWDPVEVRKTSVRLGLRTDSSQRYEKTLDSHACKRTLYRLAELILQICPTAQIQGMPISWYREETLAKPVTLHFSRERITRIIGLDLSAERLRGIFTSLGFHVEGKGDDFKVTVPTFRTTKDISCVDDLVEEVGRMIGYDNIIPVSPLLPVRPVRLGTTKTLQRRIQDFMVMEGKTLEVMTSPLIGASLLEKAAWPAESKDLVLVNALSVDSDRMRPSLIPSALQVFADNQKHFSQFGFFELGRAYRGYEDERSCLLIGLWSKDETRFVELINHVEKLWGAIGLSCEFTGVDARFANPMMPKEWKGLHPHEFLNVRVQGKYVGAMTTIHPLILKNFKMKGFASVAVIDLTEFEKRELKDKTRYHPIARFPSSAFDVSVTAAEDVFAGDILKALSGLKLKQLKSSSILDVFALPGGQKSVTLRAVFEDPTMTLGPDFLKDAEIQVVQILEKAGFSLRS